MSTFSLLDRDIVLDEQAFVDAVQDFAAVGADLERLENQVRGLLQMLRPGFDTPAGERFFSSCERNLLEPLNEQRRVMGHISENLQTAKEAYSSVFTEYESLQSAIRHGV